jgi:hypothetical protein
MVFAIPLLLQSVSPFFLVKKKGAKLFLLFFAVLAFSKCGQSQTESYDLVTFTPPKGWKKEMKGSLVQYSSTNAKTGAFGLIAIYKGTDSKGDVDDDFKADWQEFIVKPWQATNAPVLEEIQESDGWKIRGGSGQFTFSNATVNAVLVTATGYGKSVSIVMLTNSQEYQPQLTGLLSSVTLQKPAGNNNSSSSSQQVATTDPGQTVAPAAAIKTGFAFNTTNFDDGWTSTIQEDWVQVTKGNVKVLLHYPTPKTKNVGADVKQLTKLAWDVLVAPRYSNLRNFVVNYNMSYEAGNLGAATVNDNASGQDVYVVLFSQGSTGWMEVICPDKNTFIQTFGFGEDFNYNAHNDLFTSLAKLAGYNRFAVAASDLTGKWTTSFTGLTQYVNAYTGMSAGATSYSSAQEYVFGAGNTYKWQIDVASGVVGNAKFQNARSNGKFSLPSNWEVHFSDMEGKPKTYPAHFSCIKGARVLWLDGTRFAKAE